MLHFHRSDIHWSISRHLGIMEKNHSRALMLVAQNEYYVQMLQVLIALKADSD